MYIYEIWNVKDHGLKWPMFLWFSHFTFLLPHMNPWDSGQKGLKMIHTKRLHSGLCHLRADLAGGTEHDWYSLDAMWPVTLDSASNETTIQRVQMQIWWPHLRSRLHTILYIFYLFLIYEADNYIFNVFEKSHLYSLRLNLFDEQKSKHSNILKYHLWYNYLEYNLK